MSEFFFPSFPGNTKLCLSTTLKDYNMRMESLRKGEPRLFIVIIKPHGAVVASTIARWLKSILEAAGIDASIFNAHSVRGASNLG